MKRISLAVALLGILSMVLACSTPKLLSRSAVDRFVLGQTTMDEVKKIYGTQDLTYEVTTPTTGVTKLSWAHRDLMADPCQESIYAIQQVDFFFKENTLQGVQYISSLAEDCTMFDESIVSKIKPGETTKEEVKTWLGSPEGRFLEAQPGSVWRYVYVQKKSRTREYDHQVLDVLFDENDVVKDFKMESMMGL